MKILYIGTFQPHCSDRYRVKGFRQAGFEVITKDYRLWHKEFGIKFLWKSILTLLNSFEPDIVFVNKGEVLRSSHIKTLRERSPKAVWLLFYGDHLLTLPKFLQENVRLFDAVLVETDDGHYHNKLKGVGAKRVVYHHSATDLEVFKKYRDTETVCDVSFFGNHHKTFELSSMREEAIKAVVNSKYVLEIYGASRWFGKGRGMRWGEDFSKAASRSKIILGISTTARMNKFASNRVWNSMAAGFHLTHKFKGIGELFENHKHLVWFETIEEMMDLIKHYSVFDSQRDEIHLQGRELLSQKHTYYHRAKELERIYETLCS